MNLSIYTKNVGYKSGNYWFYVYVSALDIFLYWTSLYLILRFSELHIKYYLSEKTFSKKKK